MLLESTLKSDFIPMVKKPKFWIAPKTLKEGDQIEIDDATGHQVLASYPGAFRVIAYGNERPAAAHPEPQKRMRKAVEQKIVTAEQMDSKDYSDILPEVSV